MRDWNITSTYDSIIILPLGTKHDSGYSHILIVGCRDVDGCNKRQPVEIASKYSDDITWILDGHKLRSDALLKSRAMHFWANDVRLKFVVGHALSSIDVTLTREFSK